MKPTNNTSGKDFDTVKTIREIKEKIALEMSNLTFDQIKEYLRKRSAQFHQQIKP